jgi:hypothetical protein
MVEVEHDRIGLAAVNARVTDEVQPYSDAILRGHPILLHLSARDHRIAILQIPEVLVISRTRTTPRVASAGLARSDTELVVRLGYAAGTTRD